MSVKSKRAVVPENPVSESLVEIGRNMKKLVSSIRDRNKNVPSRTSISEDDSSRNDLGGLFPEIDSSEELKNYLPEYKAPEGEPKTPEDRMLRTLYKFAYDIASAGHGEFGTAERFYLMLHGFFHNGQ